MKGRILQPFWSASFTVSEEQWNNLECAGNIPLSSDHRLTLLEAMTRYREYTDGEKAAVTFTEIRGPLENLADTLTTASRALRLALRSGDRAGRAAIRAITTEGYTQQKKYTSPDELKELARQLELFGGLAKSALRKVSEDERGPPGDRYIDGLLFVAAQVFELAGGRPQFSTPKRDAAGSIFRKHICDLVGYSVQSLAALDQRLKLARKLAKTSPGRGM